ncbi:MAG: HNH endonuclease [Elusimicrobia bacterium]|nr:HNH endonuclease [Elusimicrobiota bacterium]
MIVILLAHLQEFDRRRAPEDKGYPSTFAYCTERLGLSESEAFLRIRSARAARHHPDALEMLAKGELHLSGLARLAPYLTPENAEQSLSAARGKTRREIERLALTFEHGGPKADVIRALPAPAQAPTPQDENTLTFPVAEVLCQTPPLELTAFVSPQEDSTKDRLVRISFTATEGLFADIERAKGLLRHKHPDGRLEHVIGEAIKMLLDAKDPWRQRGRGKPGRASNRKPNGRSRRIPKRVREAVMRRDEGRCAYVAEDGRRCGATEWLEYDHIKPWALGGSSDDPANVRVLCRAHNQDAARKTFGPRKDERR